MCCLLQESVVEEEEDETLGHVYKPPEPKDWVTQGSEIEIDEEALVENRKRVSQSAVKQTAPAQRLPTPRTCGYRGNCGEVTQGFDPGLGDTVEAENRKSVNHVCCVGGGGVPAGPPRTR